LENKKANPAYSDGLHLTACGYDVLADIFLKVFTG
jgi:lysophospholipase L1-like esterase